MKRSTTAVLVVVFVAAATTSAWLLSAEGDGTAVPVLAVETTDTIDLGQLFTGETVRGTVTLYNTGDAPLEITGVLKSCTCTEATVIPSMIPPGESGSLHYKYTASNTDGPDAMRIGVQTNDPAFPAVTFGFRSVVASHLVIEPPRFDIRLAAGETRSLAVRFGSARWHMSPQQPIASGRLLVPGMPVRDSDGTITLPFTVTAPTGAAGVQTGTVGLSIVFESVEGADTGDDEGDGEATRPAGAGPGRREISVPITVTVIPDAANNENHE